MKDIYDILKLFSNIRLENNFVMCLEIKKLLLTIENDHPADLLTIEHEQKNYIFVFSKTVGSIEIQKPNSNDDGYSTFEFEYSFLEDIKIMDESQLVLSYGRFYPDYLRGDLTELYNCLYDNLLCKGLLN